MRPSIHPRTASRFSPSLTSAQRAHLERRLLQERAQVLRSLSAAVLTKVVEAEDHTPAPRMSDHMAELGQATSQDSLNGVLATRATSALAEIDSALRRLYNEPLRFGLDERSGEAIPFERLDIIPWARHAITSGA